MFSSTIWEKHARVSFSKTIKIARVQSWNAIEVFEKLEEPYNYLLIIYMKKLCSHVRKSHLVILKKMKYRRKVHIKLYNIWKFEKIGQNRG
jgi:hypothetical protein